MDELERNYRDLRLAEQAILKQSLEERKARLEELEAEARYLRNLLNSLLAAPRPQAAPQPAPQAVPAPRGSKIPRRWRL